MTTVNIRWSVGGANVLSGSEGSFGSFERKNNIRKLDLDLKTYPRQVWKQLVTVQKW